MGGFLIPIIAGVRHLSRASGANIVPSFSDQFRYKAVRMSQRGYISCMGSRQATAGRPRPSIVLLDFCRCLGRDATLDQLDGP
jgi:hypothetical protein